MTSSNNVDLVSIVIPCYNGENYIEEAIQSVLSQTYTPYEIIVVNDGSSDSSIEIIKKFKLKLIEQENKGCAHARNSGLRHSVGKYLVFLDQDDRLIPEALDIGVTYFLKHPECGFVYGRNRVIDKNGNQINVRHCNNMTIYPGYSSYALLIGDRAFVPPAAAMFNRNAVIDAGGFQSEFSLVDEYVLALEIAKRYPIYCHNQIVVEYRKHMNNTSKIGSRLLPTIVLAFDSQKDYVNKNHFLKKYGMMKNKNGFVSLAKTLVLRSSDTLKEKISIK